MDQELKRLIEFNEIIQDIARSFGLDFFPQEFDIIPAQKMLEILAYRFPVNFSHWSFGRDYEMERTRYEHGYGVPYEIVLNSNPSRAYLMNSNPFAAQVLVISHVIGHSDFMKNNIHFAPSRRDIIASASEATSRFQGYEKKYGRDKVESLIDAAMSLEMNINPDFFITEESEEEQLERLQKPLELPKIPSRFHDLIGENNTEKDEEDLEAKTPLEPDQDILFYIQNHSPKPLKPWEKDVLSVIRDQSRYFVAQRRTKILNEGWATYQHTRIMDELFRRGLLTNEEHGTYNLYNSRVLASNKMNINPYLVGLKIFEDIENRWNKGRFGRDWEECTNKADKENWDLKLDKGKEKIFSVRKTYTDRFFIEHFLTEQLVKDLDLYIYSGSREKDSIEYKIVEKDWKQVRRILVNILGSFGTPLIKVENGDYKGKTELYLKHYHEGIDLDDEYRIKTMEYCYYLWGRPIWLEAMSDIEHSKLVLYNYDGDKHQKNVLF